MNYLLVLIHTLFCCKRKYKYEVSLCLVFKDEALYLKEWLEYHQLIGVEHFYLYNNFSSDNYKEVLAPYVKKGIVTLSDWPYKYAQSECYADCYNKVKDETHWLGIIDADEFVNLLKYDDIKEFFKHYSAYPAVYLHWRMFGTSGIIKEPYNTLQTEVYTATQPYIHASGKSFINNDYRHFSKIWIHHCTSKICNYPLYPIDDQYRFKPYYFNPLTYYFSYHPKACINHYCTRSYESIRFKWYKRGRMTGPVDPASSLPKGLFDYHELPCSTHDYSIQRWLTFLKLRMGIE